MQNQRCKLNDKLATQFFSCILHRPNKNHQTNTVLKKDGKTSQDKRNQQRDVISVDHRIAKERIGEKKQEGTGNTTEIQSSFANAKQNEILKTCMAKVANGNSSVE